MKPNLSSPLIAFVLFIAGSILINLSWFLGYLGFTLKNDFASHGVLIPAISLFLLYQDRLLIFPAARKSARAGNLWCRAAGSLLLLAGGWVLVSGGLLGNLSAETLVMVLVWIAGFLLFLGVRTFRLALFPLLFLLLAVPLPQHLLDAVVRFLQLGSAEVATLLFRLTGTEFFRLDQVYFKFPATDLVIEIAPQCSGIRSSTALLITTLLAGHLMLRSGWRKLLLALVAVPMALFKNAVRIVTLSLLAIHVDPHYITGSDLHHRGGIVFFIIALLAMAPVLWILWRTEQKPKGKFPEGANPASAADPQNHSD